MFEEIVKNMSIHELNQQQKRDEATYTTAEELGEHWKLLLGDSCERIKEIESNSVGRYARICNATVVP